MVDQDAYPVLDRYAPCLLRVSDEALRSPTLRSFNGDPHRLNEKEAADHAALIFMIAANVYLVLALIQIPKYKWDPIYFRTSAVSAQARYLRGRCDWMSRRADEQGYEHIPG